MIVSFDLDDTLICRNNPQAEPRVLPFNLFMSEPLRLGTVELFRKIRKGGHSIYIYTTSLRPVWRVHLWFRIHGVSVDRVINQGVHEQKMAALGIISPPSKYPPAFGIDIHIDDSWGVFEEGKRYGFQVIVISPTEVDWRSLVLKEVVDP